MKDQLEAYFRRRYSRIFDELQTSIDAYREAEGDNFDVAQRKVEWHFECEWDCDPDDWQTACLKGEITK